MHLTLENLARTLHLVADDKGLVVTFLIAFSRSEYALKRAGYFRPRPSYEGSDEGAEAPATVIVNWPRFGRAIERRYRQGTDGVLDQAIAYLCEHPPQEQAIVDGALAWVDVQRKPYQSDIQWVLALISTVRNNLFHGGKFPGAAITGPERNAELLGKSLVVLEWCIEQSLEVEGYFLSD